MEKTGMNRTRPIVKNRRKKDDLEKMECSFEMFDRFGLADMATAHVANQCGTIHGLITADNGLFCVCDDV